MALKADARRHTHQRRTAQARYAQIQSETDDGGYTTVSDFIRAWRRTEGQSMNRFGSVALGPEPRSGSRPESRRARVPKIWDRSRTILMTGNTES